MAVVEVVTFEGAFNGQFPDLLECFLSPNCPHDVRHPVTDDRWVYYVCADCDWDIPWGSHKGYDNL